jgi:hypothetical protein
VFTSEGKLAGNDETNKALFKPGVEVPLLEVFYPASLDEYIKSFIDNPSLLTSDVRSELRQYRILLQDAVPDYENLYNMNFSDYYMIKSQMKTVLEKLDGLVGKE